MKRFSLKRLPFLLALVLPLLLAYCATTPYTNRTQLMMVSQDQEMQLGLKASQQVLKQEKVSHDPVV